MMRLFLFITVLLLHSPLVAAQTRVVQPAETEVRLQQERRAAADRVARYVARTRTPRRVVQPSGRILELVDVQGRRPLYLTTFNGDAARGTGTTQLHPGGSLGLALTGAGMQLGIWDGGHPLPSHQELIGRLRFGDSADPDDHATHVAGTLVGAGVRPEARGMAYEADLVAFDWGGDTAELAREARSGLLLSNHSYGEVAGWHYGDLEGTGAQWYWIGDPTVSDREDFHFGRYDARSVAFDEVAAANPYLLPVVAAGNDRFDEGPVFGTYQALNEEGDWQTYDVTKRPIPNDGGADGFDTIAGQGNAKNVLTVGAVRAFGSGFTVSDFASFGPADDGRIKPDLVGVGENVLSATAGGADGYGISSGTSMATPNVAGTLLLLQQHYQNRTGLRMRAATLKALALHTARDLGPAGPDYQYGWGLLDAEAAIRHLEETLTDAARHYEGSLPDGGTFTQSLTVPTPGPLRLTLAWTDPAGTQLPASGPSALDDPTPHLRHDLDLRLIHEGTGTIYQPYTLDPVHPNDLAVMGDNRVDPVEQIYLADAPAGSYRLEVTHKGAFASSEQAFALLVTGAAIAPVPVALGPITIDLAQRQATLTWASWFETADGTYHLERAPLAQAGTARVFQRVGSVAATGAAASGDTYTLTDTSNPTGPQRYRLLFESNGTLVVLAEREVTVPNASELTVLSNFPNPFANRTQLQFDVPVAQEVRVEIYDALGRHVTTAFSGTLGIGQPTVTLDASAWAPGFYLARIHLADRVLTRRLLRAR